jgi:predicted peptidase
MNAIKVAILVITIFLISGSATAQLTAKYSNYGEHRYGSLRYGLFLPVNYDEKKSYPLIVYLHGSRDTVSLDLIWYDASIQSTNPGFVLTPKCEEPNLGWGDTWHDEHTIAASQTLALVDSLIRQYHIDINRLYLYGISMGGFGVFSVLSKEQGKFAAGYAICGGSNIAAAPKLLQTHLWIFHGEKDDIVPVALSRDIYKEMIRLGGAKVKYTEYPGVKHNSWENVSKENSLPSWLFAQRKDQTK